MTKSCMLSFTSLKTSCSHVVEYNILVLILRSFNISDHIRTMLAGDRRLTTLQFPFTVISHNRHIDTIPHFVTLYWQPVFDKNVFNILIPRQRTINYNCWRLLFELVRDQIHFLKEGIKIYLFKCAIVHVKTQIENMLHVHVCENYFFSMCYVGKQWSANLRGEVGVGMGKQEHVWLVAFLYIKLW